MIFVILAVVWVAVLVPPYVRNRADARPTDSIRRFRRQLAILGRAAPGSAPRLTLVTEVPSTRRSRAALRKRRKQVLVGLLAGMGITLVLGLVPGLRAVLALHGLLDVACAAYVALLVRRRREAERASVTYLPTAPSAPAEPALLVVSSAGS